MVCTLQKAIYCRCFPDRGLEFAKDLFFGTTYPGSWFLSALLVSVVLVYFSWRTIGKYVTLGITLLVSLYVSYIDQLPEYMRVAYDWYASNVRQEVNLFFPSQMVWVTIGMLIGTNLDRIMLQKRIYPLAIGIAVVFYVISILWHTILIKYVWVVSICLIAFFIELPDDPIYKRIRNYSILIFLFHFSIAGKMSLFCSFVGDSLLTNWLYYLVSIVFAEIVLRLEKVHHLGFLKYLH